MSALTEPASTLVQYLQTLVGMAGEDSVTAHVLRAGREFSSEALSNEERALVSQIRWAERAEKRCYYNAAIEAMTLDGWTHVTVLYAEGYVDPGIGIALDHAWLSINRKVVDPTCRTGETGNERIVGQIPDGWGYYGVELDPAMCAHMLQHGAAGPLINDPECGWPLIPARARVAAARRRKRDTRAPASPPPGR